MSVVMLNVVAPNKTATSCLIEGDVFHDVDGVFVERAADELEVGEDEGLVDVETDGNDVPRVLIPKVIKLSSLCHSNSGKL